MARTKVAKSRRPDAERAAEHWMHHVCGCRPEHIRRAVRTQFQSVDFFASDVMGKTLDGTNHFAQVTAGQNEAVRVRRRKLEKIPWNTHERVYVLQLVEMPDPARLSRKNFFFRVHRYEHLLPESTSREWSIDYQAYPVPKEWFKKLREVEECGQ